MVSRTYSTLLASLDDGSFPDRAGQQPLEGGHNLAINQFDIPDEVIGMDTGEPAPRHDRPTRPFLVLRFRKFSDFVERKAGTVHRATILAWPDQPVIRRENPSSPAVVANVSRDRIGRVKMP